MTVPAWRFHTGQWTAWRSPKRFKVVVAGRRWGKSELSVRWLLAGAMDDHLRGEGGVSWVVTPTYDMGRPLWRKFLKTAPAGWITSTVGTANSPGAIEIGTSRIEFRSGDHPERLVGEGLRRVALDECGTLKNQLWQESILPTLMDHSAPAILTGTPKLSTGHFFFAGYLRGLKGDDPLYGTFGGPTTENPWIPVDEVQRMREEMPSRLFEQEVLARFQTLEGMVFRNIEACLMAAYSSAATVSIGVDLARRADWTVIVGMDVFGRVTFLDRFKHVPWPVQEERILAWAERATKAAGKRPKVVVDMTGVGDPVVQHLERKGLRVEPYLFTNQSKMALVDNLSIAFERGAVGLPPDEPVLVSELRAFSYETTAAGRTKLSAPAGLHDDCVFALAMALWGVRRAGDLGITIPGVEAEAGPASIEAHPEEVVENEEYLQNPDLWT